MNRTYQSFFVSTFPKRDTFGLLQQVTFKKGLLSLLWPKHLVEKSDLRCNLYNILIYFQPYTEPPPTQPPLRLEKKTKDF